MKVKAQENKNVLNDHQGLNIESEIKQEAPKKKKNKKKKNQQEALV